MAFSDQVRGFSRKVEARNSAVFVGVAVEVQRSVTVGSEITGSRGQPVDTGALRASWIPEFVDAHHWRTSTNLKYAPAIEDGIGPHGPLTLRSSVGGFRSVAHTAANFDRIVEHVVRETAGGGA